MTETTQYPYSINFSLGSVVLMIIVMLLLLTNVIGINNMVAWIVCGISAVMFLFLVSLLIIKRVMPALRGEVAFELNEQGVVDYIRNITIDWKDMKGIYLKRGRSASYMEIALKWESDYGSQIIIPLRWVKGKDREIFEAVKGYFEQTTQNMLS